MTTTHVMKYTVRFCGYVMDKGNPPFSVAMFIACDVPVGLPITESVSWYSRLTWDVQGVVSQDCHPPSHHLVGTLLDRDGFTYVLHTLAKQFFQFLYKRMA